MSAETSGICRVGRCFGGREGRAGGDVPDAVGGEDRELVPRTELNRGNLRRGGNLPVRVRHARVLVAEVPEGARDCEARVHARDPVTPVHRPA